VKGGTGAVHRHRFKGKVNCDIDQVHRGIMLGTIILRKRSGTTLPVPEFLYECVYRSSVCTTHDTHTL
jgi:hypothetical protein